MTNSSTIYIAAQAQRARKIEMLQALRGASCKGTRELMCFLYYNASAQAYDRKLAAQKTIAFNERFDTPLPLAEVRQAIRSVDSVELTYGPYRGQRGFYPVSNAKLCNLLNVSADENTVINFTGSTAKARQRAERKLHTARKREQRNKRIKDLKASGLTNREIARQVGVSLRTVVTVTNSNTSQSQQGATHTIAPTRTNAQFSPLGRHATQGVQNNAPCIDGVSPSPAAGSSAAGLQNVVRLVPESVSSSLTARQGLFQDFNPFTGRRFSTCSPARGPLRKASLAFTAGNTHVRSRRTVSPGRL